MLKESKSKRVTIVDVAREAGVATATVSFVVNGKDQVAPQTRATVWAAIEKLGYQVDFHAQSLRKQGSDMIWLFSLNLDLGVHTRKLQLMQSLLSQRGYNVPLFAYHHDNRRTDEQQGGMMEMLCRQRPRAIVFYNGGVRAPALAQLNRYQEEGGILVGYGYGLKTFIAADHVLFDARASGREAGRYLWELGHRRIGYGFHSTGGAIGGGLREFLEEVEGKVRPEWFWSGADNPQAEIEGERLAQAFLSWRDRPSAMVIVNDTMANAFILCLQNAGLQVPGDVSVVAHDDKPIARLAQPPLTTITHPVEEIAQQVVRLLCERIEGHQGEPRHIVLKGHLIQRQSTAPPRIVSTAPPDG